MNTEIKEFCKKYKEKKELDIKRKEFKETQKEFKEDKNYIYTPIYTPNPHPLITFNIGYKCMRSFSFYNTDYNHIIELDDEDLEYLYNKYSKKLQEELDSNIEDIKNKYKELL